MYHHGKSGGLPYQYYTTNNPEYKKFLEDFTETIKKLQNQIQTLQKESSITLNSHLTQVNYSGAIMLLGGKHSFPESPIPKIVDNSNAIKKLKEKISILEKARDYSTESNFKEKAKEAIDQIEALDNPVSLLSKKYNY